MMTFTRSNSTMMSFGASAYTAEASFPMHCAACARIALSVDAMIMASILVVPAILAALASVLVLGISLLVLVLSILLAVLRGAESKYLPWKRVRA